MHIYKSFQTLLNHAIRDIKRQIKVGIKNRNNTKQARNTISLLLVLTLLVSQIGCSFVTEKLSDAGDGIKSIAESFTSEVDDIYSTITAPENADDFKAILDNITTQSIAAFVSELKANVDFETMKALLDPIGQTLKDQLNAEDIKDSKIESEIKKAKDFINDPDHILGNPSTKHGEIAEHMDVRAHNAERIVKGLEPDATIDDIGRTADVDYYIGGKAVQSKFYNSPRATLSAILEHNNDYSHFGKNGKSYYVVPKDQHSIMKQIMNNEKLANLEIEYNGSRMRLSTLENIKNEILELERRTGKKFNEIIKPSKFTYKEVQQNSSVKTLNRYNNSLKDEINTNKAAYRQIAENKKNTAISNCVKPTLLKTGQSAGIGASIVAIISVGFSIYEKTSNGKSIENFTEEDWKEVGIEGLMGAATGAGIGVATELLCIYGIPVPIAGAIIATIFQTIVLYTKYSKGELSLDEFISHTVEAGATSTLIGAGAMVGQMVIPIPIVGLLVGTLATSILIIVIKTYVNSDKIEQKAQEFIDDFSSRYNELLDTTSEAISGAVDTSKTTLSSAYSATKNCVSDAVVFASEKLKISD